MKPAILWENYLNKTGCWGIYTREFGKKPGGDSAGEMERMLNWMADGRK